MGVRDLNLCLANGTLYDYLKKEFSGVYKKKNSYIYYFNEYNNYFDIDLNGGENDGNIENPFKAFLIRIKHEMLSYNLIFIKLQPIIKDKHIILDEEIIDKIREKVNEFAKEEFNNDIVFSGMTCLCEEYKNWEHNVFNLYEIRVPILPNIFSTFGGLCSSYIIAYR